MRHLRLPRPNRRAHCAPRRRLPCQDLRHHRGRRAPRGRLHDSIRQGLRDRSRRHGHHARRAHDRRPRRAPLRSLLGGCAASALHRRPSSSSMACRRHALHAPTPTPTFAGDTAAASTRRRHHRRHARRARAAAVAPRRPRTPPPGAGALPAGGEPRAAEPPWAAAWPPRRHGHAHWRLLAARRSWPLSCRSRWGGGDEGPGGARGVGDGKVACGPCRPYSPSERREARRRGGPARPPLLRRPLAPAAARADQHAARRSRRVLPPPARIRRGVAACGVGRW